MPNLFIPASGELTVEVANPMISLVKGQPNSVFDADGSALIIHAGADDYKTDPTGDAGDRIACGVSSSERWGSAPPDREQTRRQDCRSGLSGLEARLGKDCAEFAQANSFHNGDKPGVGGVLDDPEIERLIERTPHVSIEEILANPGFPAARKLYLDRFLGVYGHDPFLVRLLIESGRFLVYHLAVVLDTRRIPPVADMVQAVGRLKQQIVASGLGASAGVRSTTSWPLARGRLPGRGAVGQRRRLWLSKPTEKMLAHDRDWLVAPMRRSRCSARTTTTVR